jgi:hypothetical protein
MTVLNQDFSFTRGDDHQAEFTITEPDGTTPKSLTGATSLKWEAFHRGVGSAVIQKSLGTGIVLFNVNATDDGVRVVLDDSDTASLDIDDYEHELEAVLGGKRVTLAQGTMTLLKELIANT